MFTVTPKTGFENYIDTLICFAAAPANTLILLQRKH